MELTPVQISAKPCAFGNTGRMTFVIQPSRLFVPNGLIAECDKFF
jgi:hypothetical protein